MRYHHGDPCSHCGIAHDDVPIGSCERNPRVEPIPGDVCVPEPRESHQRGCICADCSDAILDPMEDGGPRR
jgi:hypothetical protein